jgi:GNAT superfamily N-acetyltransferase
LVSIAVDKEYRGTGVAYDLFLAFEEEVRKQGHNCFKIMVGSRLMEAQKFYSKHGATLHSKIKTHGKSESYLYIKELTRL